MGYDGKWLYKGEMDENNLACGQGVAEKKETYGANEYKYVGMFVNDAFEGVGK